MLAYHSLLIINDITSIQTFELNLIWGLAVAHAYLPLSGKVAIGTNQCSIGPGQATLLNVPCLIQIVAIILQSKEH